MAPGPDSLLRTLNREPQEHRYRRMRKDLENGRYNSGDCCPRTGVGFRGTNLLYVMAELGVADLLADGPRSGAALASTLEAEPDALYRILRALAQIGVLEQRSDGRFELTPVGDCLRSDRQDSLRPVARFWGHEMLQRAWGNLLHTVMTGETAFDHVFKMPAFAYLEAHPSASALYNTGMAQMRARSAPAVAAAYDFEAFGVIVDVGSGNGSLLAAIPGAYPGRRGIMFDLSHAGPAAEEVIRSSNLTGRATFEAGDFFVSVPSGGDCYVLRQVIHDWDDDRALAILECCRRAMHRHGRLLLIELLLPVEGEPGLEVIMVDVTMLARVGGRERTEIEYRSVLARAGFCLDHVIPTQAGHHILECAPV